MMTQRPSAFCGTAAIAFAFVSDGYANARILEFTVDGKKVCEWGSVSAGLVSSICRTPSWWIFERYSKPRENLFAQAGHQWDAVGGNAIAERAFRISQMGGQVRLQDRATFQ